MSKDDGSLNRVYRDNLSHIDAFAEDYSYFGNALIDMYEASFDSKYLELSKKFADILVDKFFNDGYFKQSLSKNMVINSVNSMDNATPSYNFTSSLLLIRLHYYFGNENYRQIVRLRWKRLEFTSTNILMLILQLFLLIDICQKDLMRLLCRLLMEITHC